MSQPVETISPEAPVAEAAEIMLKKGFAGLAWTRGSKSPVSSPNWIPSARL